MIYLYCVTKNFKFLDGSTKPNQNSDSEENGGEGVCKAHSWENVCRIAGEPTIYEQIATMTTVIHKTMMKRFRNKIFMCFKSYFGPRNGKFITFGRARARV